MSSSPISSASNEHMFSYLHPALSENLQNNKNPLFTLMGAGTNIEKLTIENDYLKQLVTQHAAATLALTKASTRLYKENKKLRQESHKIKQVIALFLGTCCGIVLGTLANRFIDNLTKQKASS